MSTVEASRQPEAFWHVWAMPKVLRRDEAYRYFMERVKPKTYIFEKFRYDPHKGAAYTI